MPMSQSVVTTLRAKVQSSVIRSMFAGLMRMHGVAKSQQANPSETDLEQWARQRRETQAQAALEVNSSADRRRRERLAALLKGPAK